MSHGFLQTWQLAITPLSPIHIGTGEDYEPTQYVIDGERLFSFSPEAALRSLPDTARADLLRILQGPPTVDLLKHVQAFFHRNGERLIPEAEHVIPTLPSIAAEYVERVGRTAQREQSGREIINQLRIARTYADPATRRPILPGSSLKGAIRTALLDRTNRGASLTAEEKSLPPQKRNLALQQRLFRYRAGKFELDPMRLVQLGDAADQRPQDTYGTEIRYAVNRKRHAVFKDGREVLSQADNLRQVIECVPLMRPRAFVGRLAIQDASSLNSPKLPDSGLRWTFTDLAGACNAFYRPILERELAELAGRSYLDNGWRTAVETVLAVHRDALDERRAFLLRVGFHSGAESVTLNGVRDIKIMTGKGSAPVYLPLTKTVWLAAREIQDRRDLVPFGWVLVEAARHGQTLPSWPADLTASCGAFAVEEQAWIAGVNARRTELLKRLDEQRAREEALRIEAEQARLAEEARAAQMASLSAEGRRLAELRDRFETERRAGRCKAGGEVASALVDLLKEAQENGWSTTDCVSLADLAEEIYAHIGWPSGPKKSARKAQIQALREKGST